MLRAFAAGALNALSMPLTNGFASPSKRFDHWNYHGGDFGPCNVFQYEQMADNFLGGPCPVGVFECVRRSGDRIRYDQGTGTFGIISRNAIIKTYFKPIPCSLLPVGYTSMHCHGHVDNVTYFRVECRK